MESKKTFEIETLEDVVKIKCFNGIETTAKIIGEVIYNSYEFEFKDLISEEKYDSLFEDKPVVFITHLFVDKKYRNTGVASTLLEKLLNKMKEDRYSYFYLNASPLTFDTNLTDLIRFYKKFGFKILLSQGKNCLMYLN